MSRLVTADGFGTRFRALRAALFATSAFLVTSCLTPAPPAAGGAALNPKPVEPRPISVVLLAIDGVRWQEVFHGIERATQRGALAPAPAEALMPNLHGLVNDGGVLVGDPDSGTGVFASGPEFLSLPGYSEMLSGRRVTNCKDNGCAATVTTTLADEIATAPGTKVGDVAIVTSWPDIGRIAAKRADRVAMSTGRNGGPTRELFRNDPVSRALVDEAARTAPEPGVGDFRPDRLTAQIAVRYLEQRRPRFLFVSLGEPDEFAHRGDYGGYLAALRRADLTIGLIARALDEQARRGARTVLFVTADHGRAHDFDNHGRQHPESSRVWLLAWGSEVSKKPFGGAGAHYLADLAPSLRVPFGLAADRHPDAGRPLAGLLEGPAR